MTTLDELVDDLDWRGVFDHLQSMDDGAPRDRELEALQTSCGKVKRVPFDPSDYVVLEVEDRGDAQDRWWDTLSFAALGRDSYGWPVVALDVDPVTGETPARASCLTTRADLAFWRGHAETLSLASSEQPIEQGLVLVDLVGGVGRAELILRGPCGGPAWERWTIVLD